MFLGTALSPNQQRRNNKLENSRGQVFPGQVHALAVLPHGDRLRRPAQGDQLGEHGAHGADRVFARRRPRLRAVGLRHHQPRGAGRRGPKVLGAADDGRDPPAGRRGAAEVGGDDEEGREALPLLPPERGGRAVGRRRAGRARRLPRARPLRRALRQAVPADARRAGRARARRQRPRPPPRACRSRATTWTGRRGARTRKRTTATSSARVAQPFGRREDSDPS